MASIIEGYKYDIFISYRQKDNKGGKWVSEFVDSLNNELESTFKEEINVYFDINPYDGLLETHDVDASLNEKLHCLVFIPIISRTYCDPKSFAWKHEFMAFIEQASQDQLGLKVKLLNGNVASRVLPVRIHDLNITDLRLCEDVLDGGLRSIDFIYKSPGVNRPLRADEDHPHDNLNKIYYRDQINKVANAIYEIINGLNRLHTSSLNDNLLLKGTESQEDVLKYDKSSITLPEQTQVRDSGTILINRNGRLNKYKKLFFKNLGKTIFSFLVTASVIILVFSGEGPTKFFGINKTKKEVARSHVINAVDLIDNDQLEAAKGELKLALESDPKNSNAWSSMAAVSVREGDLNTAILQTLEAIKLDPDNCYAAYNLAYALDDKKDYNQAIKWYEKAIEIDSAFIPAYSALGRLYNSINQPIDAILILSLAKDKYPESNTIYLIYKNLGNAYLLQEQIDTAVKYLELSREIKKDELETNLFLAKAYEASSQLTKSIDSWQNYIELEKDTLKINETKNHIKDITMKHLQEIIK
ncbi:MAG TPA: tetratricopeptide repeat protein [Bacteroidales bacterium]|nr:tetratricopeptide repeat protein [Bacteroidales bacterium]